MTTQNTGQQFPLENLGSKLSRNNFNFESILNGLVNWDKTDQSHVTIRIATDTAPYYQDYIIPSKKTVQDGQSKSSTIEEDTFSSGDVLGTIGANYLLGDTVHVEITFNNYGQSDWELYADPIDDSVADILVQEFPYETDDVNFVPPTVVSLNYTLLNSIKRFYLKPVSSGTGASITSIVRYKEIIPDTPYNRTVGIHDTVDYQLWPYDTSIAWDKTKIGKPNPDDNSIKYFETDESILIDQKQKYSASMIFDHNSQKSKTVNFINYEGPDLDQGLCIYLPINSGGAVPMDGFTFEFHFRIWPNPEYTQALTVDHIINKAQIYVYSVPDIGCIDSPGNPISRFSMARMTNYYIWAENIAIPDKPVSYYAQFIYSKSLNSWMLLNFNQLDDHIFVGPIGFVDPVGFAFNELDSGFGEYQTHESSALPTYTDPFSNIDLTRYSTRNEDGNGLSTFNKRLI